MDEVFDFKVEKSTSSRAFQLGFDCCSSDPMLAVTDNELYGFALSKLTVAAAGASDLRWFLFSAVILIHDASCDSVDESRKPLDATMTLNTNAR